MGETTSYQRSGITEEQIAPSELFSADELLLFREVLRREKAIIISNAKQAMAKGSIKLDTNEMRDDVDLAAINIEQDLTFRLLNRDRQRLFEIERALGKIKSGDYGYCEGTGDPIPKKRLELAPWTRHSVTYKEYLERMKKSGRGVGDEIL
jgi:DnaK suppressor protein